MTKLESMSKNIVDVMITLSKNEMLGRLLIHDVSNPYNLSLDAPVPEKLINPTIEDAKILPFPFDADGVTDLSGSFIRVYYNDGEFNGNQTIADSDIHIDIICAKDLWLINNGRQSLIRPYDIVGRVVDLVGKRSVGNHIKLNFSGFQHLYINKKFDCIRLYAEYMSVET